MSADHQPFLGFRKELAFGLKDGRLMAITEVAKGAACGCVCPVCDVPLIARQGDILVHHFAHAGAGEGCGVGVETNAHLWAKDELARALRIHLPPIEAEAAGLTETVHKGGDFRFALAELEKHAGDIVPDVLLTAPDGRKLIVEVYVTHRCGPEKIDRIRASGVSAIEVDLRRWRQSHDAADIAKGLLREAPRKWLYNPTLDEARTRLEAEAQRRARDAAARRAQRASDEVARIRRAPVRSPVELERLRAVLESLGHGRLVVGDAPGDGFIVPARLWKAAALGRLIRDTPTEGRGPQVTADRLIGLIPDCLYRDPRFVRPNIPLQEMKAAVPTYRTVWDTMEAFIETLHEEDVVYYRKGDLWISPDVVARARALATEHRQRKAAADAMARRRTTAHDLLGRLFRKAAVDPEGPDFSLRTWTQNLSCSPGKSLDALITAGDETWARLKADLAGIEAMLDGGTPVDDLMGLPFVVALEDARDQADAIAAAERAAAEETDRLAREARRSAIEDEAFSALGRDGTAWLVEPAEGEGAPRIEVADGSAAGLARIRAALRQRTAEVVEAQRRTDEIEGFRGTLRKAADAAFTPDRATLFLNSSRPELDLKSPLTACVDAYTLERCLRLLPGARGRR